MNLTKDVAAASRAAKRNVLLEFCHKNPKKSLEEIGKELGSEALQDIFFSLTVEELGAAPKASKKPKGRKKKTTNAAPVKTATPHAAAGKERATKPQVHVTTALMQMRNNADIGDELTMADMRKATTGTSAQVKTAMKKISGFKTKGAGRNTVYIVTQNAVTAPSDEDEDEGEEEEIDEDLREILDDGEEAA